MRKRLFWRGSRRPLFSDSEIFGVDRSSAPALKRPDRAFAHSSNLQCGSRPCHMPPFCSPGWTSACTSCCTSCQAVHQHLAATAATGQHHIPGIARSERCLEIQRLASVRECLPHRVPSQPLCPGLLALYLS